MGKSNGKKKQTNNDEVNKTKRYKVKASKTKKTKGNKKKHPKLRKAILIIFVLAILLCLIGAGIIAGIFFSDKFKLTEEELKITNINGSIKDKNGVVIGTLSGDENRKIVTFDDMPAYLPKAFVAIEDKRFYEHSGVDIKRTGYAIVMYALNKGEASSGGGSTITQQLIKNLMNDKANEGAKGIERKIREMARAYNVEKILSKDQILELYLNKIFMGSTVYGVGMASEYYFNKPVAELDLAECAFLAGINHTPNSYNPFNPEDDNSEIIKKRTKEVLYQMKEQGYITSEEEYNAAVEKVENGLTFVKGDISSKANYSYHTTAAINQVIEDLMEEKGINRDTAEFIVYNNGYTIYTTQDTSIQDRMEAEYVKDTYIKTSKKTKDANGNYVHSQSAMVIIDHTNGQVVGVVGGLGTDSNSTGQNRATQSTRQPGSSIKPISVIAPALEKNVITAGTVLDNSPTKFSGGFSPRSSTSGLTSVRHGIEISSNIMQCKILSLLGVSNSIEFTKNIGITTIVTSKENSSHNDESLSSMALGGLTKGVSPLEMAAAYAAIANDGEYISPVFYTKVEDSKGNVVLESKQEKRRVMSEANAYVLKSILTSPVTGSNGTATGCSISGMSVGAKTGTTNDNYDRWLCGFTPYYAAATWTGFDEPEDINRYYSGNPSSKIWAAVMRDIHKNLPSKTFQKPSNVVSVTICLDSGCVATESCSRQESEVFVKGTVPEQCEGHTKLNICKETGKIANEYCKDVEEKTYLVKPEKENTKLWTTDAGEKYNIQTENCDVHKAPEQVDMVNVVGKKLEDAKKQIEELGLTVEVKYKENKDKANGIVLEQSVKEKEKVEKGKTITLTVNKINNDDKNNDKNDDKNNNQNKINNEEVSNTQTTNTTNNTTT